MRCFFPQSALLRHSEPVFRPSLTWCRLSFLELISPDGDLQSPTTFGEPAYDEDGSTPVAVWPPDGRLEMVRVAAWTPSTDTIRELAVLQFDWPPPLCDVRVRVDEAGTVVLRPCLHNLHRNARYADSPLSARVLRAIEVGLRSIGRPTRTAT